MNDSFKINGYLTHAELKFWKVFYKNINVGLIEQTFFFFGQSDTTL